MKRLLIALAAVVLLGAATASAALLQVDGGTLQVFVFPFFITPSPTPAPVAATVDIKPDSLQKRSQGGPVTAYIELPEGFDVANIDVATVELCFFEDGGCVLANAKPTAIGDYDGDGIPDLMVKFDRAAVIALVSDIPAPTAVEFTVRGFMSSPPVIMFEGKDTVNLVDPETTPEEPTATATPAETPTPEPTETVEATATPAPTETPATTPTLEPTATPISEPTATPTETPTQEATETVEPTLTSTSTPEPTATPTPADTPTPGE